MWRGAYGSDGEVDLGRVVDGRARGWTFGVEGVVPDVHACHGDTPLVEAWGAALQRDVSSALARARQQLEPGGDPAVAAVLSAAEQMAVQWRNEQERVHERRLALEESMLVERKARCRLEIMLGALTQLSSSLVLPGAQLLRTTGEGPFADTVEPNPPVMAHHRESADDELPSGAATAAIAVCLLGRFRLFVNGRPIRVWPGTKTPRVAQYLFAHASRVVSRDQLIDLFWPEVDPETGRRNLHQVIYAVRKALRSQGARDHVVVYANDAYAVDRGCTRWSDVDEFERLAAAGRRAETDRALDDAIASFEAAEHCYTGDFLEDNPYEEWALAERDRLRLLYVDVVNRLADLTLTRGEIDRSLDLTQRVLLREPCDELSHRRALRCYAALGNRQQLIRQYRSCRQALERDFGVEPAVETSQLYSELMTG